MGNGDAYAPQFAASNGLNVNNGTIGTSYTFPTGYNSVEAGDVLPFKTKLDGVAADISVSVPSCVNPGREFRAVALYAG